MGKKKRIMLMLSVFFLAIVIIIGYLTITFMYQEYSFENEMDKVIKLDITKDKFNTSYVTLGKYRQVEKAIKNYLESYASSLQDMNKVTKDEKFANILSFNNLSTDNECKESIKYVTELKNKFNEDIDNLIELSDKDNMKKNINNYNVNKKYKNIYEEYMFDETIQVKFIYSIEDLNKYKESMNLKFDTSLQIFDFFNKNRENILFEDNQVKFGNRDLLNKYNELVNKIKRA